MVFLMMFFIFSKIRMVSFVDLHKFCFQLHLIHECQAAYRLTVEIATTHDGNPVAQTAEDYVVNPA